MIMGVIILRILSLEAFTNEAFLQILSLKSQSCSPLRMKQIANSWTYVAEFYCKTMRKDYGHYNDTNLQYFLSSTFFKTWRKV